MLAFIQRRSFATLVDAALRVTQVPIIVDEPNNRLLIHISRGNPVARALPTRVVAIISGADGYVSPDWYTKPDQVPTWDYESVEVTGILAQAEDALLMDMLARLSEEHEARIPDKPPWKMNKLSGPTLAKLLKGIVGATLSIESVRGTQKLSQNKSSEDIAGVIAGLKRSLSPSNQGLAERMARVTQGAK